MRASFARALLPALVVLTLVGVVAIAATGSTDTGSSDGRPPADQILDTIISLGLLALIPGAALLIYGLMQREAVAQEIASGRYRRTSFIGFVIFMLLFTVVVYVRLRDWNPPQFVQGIGEQGFPGEGPPPQEPGPDQPTTYDPEFAWLPVLVVLGLAALGAAALFLSARRQALPMRDEEAIAGALAEVLDDTLDDLRAERDPRKAVIAAYARLERVLGAHGLPRRPAETPQEYLARLLPDLDVDRRSVRRLTDLFTRAKFSRHEVDTGMKEEAIGALAQVRDELRESLEREPDAPLPPLQPDEGRA